MSVLKNNIRDGFIKLWFILHNKKGRNRLMTKSINRFFCLQELGRMYDSVGDLRTSFYFSDKSFYSLNKFTFFCKIQKIEDITAELKKYRRLYEYKNSDDEIPINGTTV